MRLNYVSLIATCLLAGASAVETKQEWWEISKDPRMEAEDSWWEGPDKDNSSSDLQKGSFMDYLSNSQAVSEASAIDLAKQEAELLDKQATATKEAAEAEAAETAAAAEAQRIAAEEEALLAKQKAAAEEAARIEDARLVAEEAAAEKAEQQAAMEAAAQEAAKMAAEEAARMEEERILAEKEALRLADEAAAMEKARIEQEEADRVEKKRLAEEQAAQLAAAQAAVDEVIELDKERRELEEEAMRQAEVKATQMSVAQAAGDESKVVEEARVNAEQKAASIEAAVAADEKLKELEIAEKEAVGGYSDLEHLFQEEAASAPVAAVEQNLNQAVADEVSDAKPEETAADVVEEAIQVVEKATEELSDALQEETGADEETAKEVARETMIDTIDEATSDQANRVVDETDTTIDEAADIAEVVVAEVLAKDMDGADDLCKREEAAFLLVKAEMDRRDAEGEMSADSNETAASEEVSAEISDAIQEVANVMKEQFGDSADDASVEEIAATVVEAASCKLAEAKDGEDLGYSIISAALFELTEEEIAALHEMEEEIVLEECAIAEAAAASNEPEVREAAEAAIVELECELNKLKDAEEKLKETLQAEIEESEEEVVMTPEEIIASCANCTAKYIAKIDDLSAQEKEVETMTDAMAQSLAEIDPNTENAAEGKALLKKMYKLWGMEPDNVVPEMPETPEQCVTVVAGKVIQLENLQQDVAKASSFRDFFADVYCAAYVNSIVTMKDGLSQLMPGGLDWKIEEELQRVYGPFEIDQLNVVEIAAIEGYLAAVESGNFTKDESLLIPSATPLKDALDRCDPIVVSEIDYAKNDREDYLFDHNFLRYLRTL